MNHTRLRRMHALPSFTLWIPLTPRITTTTTTTTATTTTTTTKPKLRDNVTRSIRIVFGNLDFPFGLIHSMRIDSNANVVYLVKKWIIQKRIKTQQNIRIILKDSW